MSSLSPNSPNSRNFPNGSYDSAAGSSDSSPRRAAMIDGQLRVSDVHDKSLLAAMAHIAREDFLPKSQADLAYIDRPIMLSDIAPERGLNAPLAVARLILAADINPLLETNAFALDAVSPADTDSDNPQSPPPSEKQLLLIGAATGYSAAVLALMGMRVVAIESDKALLAMARKNLARYPLVTIIESPLTEGIAAHSTFDRIIIDGAIDALPDSLAALLAEGGIITCGLRENRLCRLVRGIKIDGNIRLRAIADMDMVPLAEFAQPQSFVF